MTLVIITGICALGVLFLLRFLAALYGERVPGNAVHLLKVAPARTGGDEPDAGETTEKLNQSDHRAVRRASDRPAATTAPWSASRVDLVTTSASGLDPEITPAAADFQVLRVAHERGMSEEQLRRLVARHTAGRQWQFLGEARVNVLELNLDLDAAYPMNKRAAK